MFKTRRALANGIAGAALMLMVSAAASADMYTFWKTSKCPVFIDPDGGNIKTAIASVRGVMETVQRVDRLSGVELNSIGGVYCNLFNNETTEPPLDKKQVNNAYVGPEGTIKGYACVVCQYHNKVIWWAGAMPGLSASAIAFVGGGLAFCGLARLRRRQAQVAA